MYTVQLTAHSFCGVRRNHNPKPPPTFWWAPEITTHNHRHSLWWAPEITTQNHRHSFWGPKKSQHQTAPHSFSYTTFLSGNNNCVRIFGWPISMHIRTGERGALVKSELSKLWLWRRTGLVKCDLQEQCLQAGWTGKKAGLGVCSFALRSVALLLLALVAFSLFI